MTAKASQHGPTQPDGSINTRCPHCKAWTVAHKHVVSCWRCGRDFRTGKS